MLIGKSVIARAKNGTGKTGAFVIPILEKIDTSRNAIQCTFKAFELISNCQSSYFGSNKRTGSSDFFDRKRFG